MRLGACLNTSATEAIEPTELDVVVAREPVRALAVAARVDGQQLRVVADVHERSHDEHARVQITSTSRERVIRELSRLVGGSATTDENRRVVCRR